MAAFVAARRAGLPAEVHGTGKQTRDFVAVDDAVDAVVRATTSGTGLVVNVGTGVQTSVNDAARAGDGRAGDGATPRPGARRATSTASPSRLSVPASTWPGRRGPTWPPAWPAAGRAGGRGAAGTGRAGHPGRGRRGVRASGGELGDDVAGADGARTTTRALTPLRCSSRPTAELTERSASSPKRALNLWQPGVRLVGDLDDRRPERQARARREVGLAQVEVEVELVAGQRPAVTVGRAGQQGGSPGR